MKRKCIWPFFLIIPIILILFGMLYFHLNYFLWEDQIYLRDLEVLDLSGNSLPDLEPLQEFSQLKKLDLQDTGLTISQYDLLAAQLPNCEILWSVPFQGSYLSTDTEELTLHQVAKEDLSPLQHLPQLKKLTLVDCNDTDLIETLVSNLPNCVVLPQYTFGSVLLDRTDRLFTSTNIKNITDALELFPQLTLIDATDCPNYEALAALQSQYPECKILYNVPLGGKLWRECSTEISVETATSDEITNALKALPWAKTITITQPVPDPDVMLQLRQDYPHICFSYNFDLGGVVVNSQAETVNISGAKLKNAAEFEKYLPHFPNIKKAEMCRCGISNEEMDGLKQRYPDIFFVWEVKIGHAWIRTDVTYFMPYQHHLVLYDHHVDNMKYLTELICLDMGHMKVTRTDYLAYMPKLQYLLMCKTPITDISYCANMKDLKYLELFITKVTDFSPLLECEKLEDINIAYTRPSNPMIFGQMTQLKNLWFPNILDHYSQNQLRQALPDTNIVFVIASSTGAGWRKLPNYYAQRDILGMSYMIED